MNCGSLAGGKEAGTVCGYQVYCSTLNCAGLHILKYIDTRILNSSRSGALRALIVGWVCTPGCVALRAPHPVAMVKSETAVCSLISALLTTKKWLILKRCATFSRQDILTISLAMFHTQQ